MNKILFFFCCLGFVVGCASTKLDSGERTKLPAAEAIKINLTVSKMDLNLALGDEYKTSKLRSVEVFQNSTSAASHAPVFRLFDVDPGSVYDLLGLKEADIVVAVNQRLIVAPHVIGQLVRMLPKEKSIEIEVLRGGKSYLLTTKFL